MADMADMKQVERAVALHNDLAVLRSRRARTATSATLRIFDRIAPRGRCVAQVSDEWSGMRAGS